MREIKFRAWIKKEKLMANSFDIEGIYPNMVRKLEIAGKGALYGNQYILMQFTGLKDKNGKEIYEGDIIYINRKKSKRENDKGKLLVVWTNDLTSFEAKRIDEIDYIDDLECLGNFRFKEYNLEVIGNKFENPELLK